MENRNNQVHPASFRDPSGFIFWRDGYLYRQVNNVYRGHYDHLTRSGLYANLSRSGDLINHDEIDLPPELPEVAYKVLRPALVPFISYPSEWSFTQLKDAALLTLRIQRTALRHGMWLKDASAYNVQFLGGKPVFVDTLSFERLPENQPWVAYRQFCEHFLAPLALMSEVDEGLGRLQISYMDGIPLGLAVKCLPARARFRRGLFVHLYLHAGSQRRYADSATKGIRAHMSFMALQGLLDSVEKAIEGLKYRLPDTGWTDYYDTCTYSARSLEAKRGFVAEVLDLAKPKTLWDLGANTGIFSFLAAERGISAVAFDSDFGAVERLYREVKTRAEKNVLPLVVDLTIPTPSIGWGNDERAAFLTRGPVEMAFALALVHHLAIGKNVPLGRIVEVFRRISPRLVVEFVPKDDPQTQRLLRSRQDVFDEYSQDQFEAAFQKHYRIVKSGTLPDGNRILYYMEG